MKNQKLERRQEIDTAASFVSTYANNVLLAMSPWDFRLTFGVIVEGTKRLLRIKNECEVYMSPQHAKAFLRLLESRVADYERKFGPIPMPPQPKDDEAAEGDAS
ncbi:MAG: DUF3467 domain-containing protein [Vicinamibacterales bacterium]